MCIPSLCRSLARVENCRIPTRWGVLIDVLKEKINDQIQRQDDIIEHCNKQIRNFKLQALIYNAQAALVDKED